MRATVAAALGLLLTLGLSCIRAAEPAAPLFSFGAVADVQYADKDPSGPRQYRAAKEKLAAAVAELNRHDLRFVVQLGDLADGQVKNAGATKAEREVMLAVLKELRAPLRNVVGNHDLTAGPDQLKIAIGLDRFYYDFTLPGARGWRFVVLDGNDGDYGAMGDAQLAWFRGVLAQAKAAGEKVVCFCHFALAKEAAPKHRFARPEPVLQAMDEAGNVVAWFSGHDHAGGYGTRNGVHHLTLQGMIEAPKDQNAFAIVAVYPDKLAVTGFGTVPSRELPLPVPPRVEPPL